MTEAEETRLRGIEEAADRVRLLACGVMFPTPGYTSLIDALGRLHKALAPVEPEALTEHQMVVLEMAPPFKYLPEYADAGRCAATRLRFLEAERKERRG